MDYPKIRRYKNTGNQKAGLTQTLTGDNRPTDLQMKRKLNAMTEDPSFKEQLRMAVAADAVFNVAREAGIEINPTALVNLMDAAGTQVNTFGP